MNNIVRSGLIAFSFGLIAVLLLSTPARAGGHDRNTKGGVSVSSVGQGSTDDQGPFGSNNAADPGDQKDKKKEKAQEQRAQRPDHGADQNSDDQRDQKKDRKI
jgi:hypothetical protein